MKKNIALILLLVLSLHVLAQNKNHIIRVDWKAIEKTVKTRPDSVKALVARFVQPQMDTTLTLPECILAYYGQSYISKGNETLDVMQMSDSLKVKPTAALRLAEKAMTERLNQAIPSLPFLFIALFWLSFLASHISLSY